MKTFDYIQFAKDKKFWLKDFDKTKAKWENYLKKDYSDDELLNLLEYRKWYGDWYSENLLLWVREDFMNYWYAYNLIQSQEYTKSIINSIKTIVNNKTLEFNKDIIRDYLKCEKNQAHRLAIRLYLLKYEEINKKMSEILLYLLEAE